VTLMPVPTLAVSNVPVAPDAMQETSKPVTSVSIVQVPSVAVPVPS